MADGTIMNSSTLSIRVPADTRRWLDRFAKSRGTAGSAASRLLEEAKRHERFRAVEFRDTPHGRLAYVQGTRVQVFYVWMAARDFMFDATKVAGHFGWPLWKAEAALAYAEAYKDEIQRDVADYEAIDFEKLKRVLPNLNIFDHKG